MKKIVKEHYQDILADLKPIIEKWGYEGVIGTIWTYRRSKGLIEKFEKQKQDAEKQLTNLKRYEDLPR